MKYEFFRIFTDTNLKQLILNFISARPNMLPPSWKTDRPAFYLVCKLFVMSSYLNTFTSSEKIFGLVSLWNT